MRYDRNLQDKFNLAIKKISITFNVSSKKAEVGKIIQIITDEKIYFHNYDTALEKIIKLKSILKESEIPISEELLYHQSLSFLQHEETNDMTSIE